MTQIAQLPHAVASKVAVRIVAGALTPGDRVPSVRALAEEMRCAPGTAARAHAILREAGLIAGPPRAAAVVTEDALSRALAFRGATGAVRLAGSDDPASTCWCARSDRPSAVDAGRRQRCRLAQLARGTVDAAAVHLLTSARAPTTTPSSVG